MERPVIFLAFSNDRVNYLDNIDVEMKNINEVLRDHRKNGIIDVETLSHTSIDEIFNIFALYKDRIVIFHYGGHSNGTHLQLEEGAGQAQPADARGVAQLMGQQKKLQLVFLNGCATRDQVDLLFAAGVRAVIATSVHIKDKMATEFAGQFYKALAEKSSIKEAFEHARAYMNTKKPHREIKFCDYRQAHFECKPCTNDSKIPWGLYYDEKYKKILNWRLPESARRYDEPPQSPNDPEINKYLINMVSNAMVPYNERVSGMKKNVETPYWMYPAEIINSFPSPVGNQLERLFSGNSNDGKRLRQLVVTYDSITQLTCFIMVSQLWEECHNDSELVSDNGYMQELHGLFTLREDNYREFDYVQLTRAIAGFLKGKGIQPFVEELEGFEENFRGEDEFYQAYRFFEDLKKSISPFMPKVEIERFCKKGERHLSTILSRLAFIVKYRITSIKGIEVVKYRFRAVIYNHWATFLYTGKKENKNKLKSEYLKYNSFADHESVFLFKDLKNIREGLSLSPFVVDKLALEDPKNGDFSLLFFYSYTDHSGDRYCYNSFDIDKEDESFEVSNTKHPEIKKQFAEFKETCLKEVNGP